MTTLHIDFETRSTVDLKTAGLDNYARHPTTDTWCMAAAFDDGPVRIWTPSSPVDDFFIGGTVRGHVVAGEVVTGHNVAFELAIWNSIMTPRYGWPPLKPEQCRCTMAMAYAMALPGSLEKAAAAVGIAEQKDLAGGRLMMQMAKPRAQCERCRGAGGECPGCAGTGFIWWDEPDKLQRLYEYCKQDVRVERELDKRLMQLSASEQKLWQLDYEINQRGIYVDRATVQRAVAIVQSEQDRLNVDIRKATGNAVGFCTEAARITKWVQSRGVPVDGIAKADIVDALEMPGLPEEVRVVLLLRQEAGRSSTAKLSSMTEAASADGRLRGMLQYHGAGTGRWAGRRVQLHNMPRPKLKQFEIEQAIEVLHRYEPRDAAEWLRVFYESPLEVISSSLRGMLCAAPGHELLAADFANIEGRGLAWLAGEQWKLDAFRAYDAGTGPDLYELAAAKIGTTRQIGKVSELACGYGGGVGAFQTMGKNYGVKVPDEKAEEIKVAWREANPNIVRYWYALDAAVFRAVHEPGTTCSAGALGREVAFKVKGSFLWCKLPSGRVLCYPYPTIKKRETPWGEMKDQIHYMTVDGTTNKWEETHTYGGKLSENVTQAICRDLLASAIIRCEEGGYPVVLHVHDELVTEVPAGNGVLESFERLCSKVPAWAAGLPVVAKGWKGRRYRK